LSDAAVADQIIDRVATWVRAEGEPMAGVIQTLDLLRLLDLRLAIASSSPRRMIDVVCERLGLTSIEVRCSAIDEVRGKPAPDVYLTAARRLSTSPRRCPWRSRTRRAGCRQRRRPGCAASPSPTRCSPATPATGRLTSSWPTWPNSTSPCCGLSAHANPPTRPNPTNSNAASRQGREWYAQEDLNPAF